MNNKLLELVEQGWEYKALYAYDITHEKTIPVIIVSTYTQEIAEQLQEISQAWWIVLTKYDLEHGHDVYSIILHHIQCRSECIVWDDVLSTLLMSSTDMRPHLEWHIRHVLIDLREAIIQKKRIWELLPWFTIQADRIRCACWFLISWKSAYVESIADIIELINEKRGIDHWELYRTLHHWTWTVDIYKAHELFDQLVAHVDTIHKNPTNK